MRINRIKEITEKTSFEKYLHDHFWWIGPAVSEREVSRAAKRIGLEITRQCGPDMDKNSESKEFVEACENAIKAAKEAKRPEMLAEARGMLQMNLTSQAAQTRVEMARAKVAKPIGNNLKEIALLNGKGLEHLFRTGMAKAIGISQTDNILNVVAGPFSLTDERIPGDPPIITPAVVIRVYLKSVAREQSFRTATQGAGAEQCFGIHPTHTKEMNWPWIKQESFIHPHVASTTMCLGAARDMIARDWASGDIAHAIEAIITTLGTYNGSSPHAPLISFEKPEMRKCEKCETLTPARSLYLVDQPGNVGCTRTGTRCGNCATRIAYDSHRHVNIPREFIMRDASTHQNVDGRLLDTATLYWSESETEAWGAKRAVSRRRGTITAYCKELRMNVTFSPTDGYASILALDEAEITKENVESKLEILESMRAKMSSDAQYRVFSALDQLRRDAVKSHKPGNDTYTEEAAGRRELLKKTVNDLENLAKNVEENLHESQQAASQGNAASPGITQIPVSLAG